MSTVTKNLTLTAIRWPEIRGNWDRGERCSACCQAKRSEWRITWVVRRK